METIKGRITHATKTEAEWNKSTVVLLKGEVGFASDTQVIKVGNGKDLWKNLKSHQGGKGDQGDPLTIKTTATLSNGDKRITFSDGKTLTIPKGATGDRGVKGDNLTISSTTKDSKGNTVITFSDGTKTTINKGDKGDPLTFNDLTPEQIEQIKAKDVDLSNYATKDDLSKVDVSGQLADYAKKDHTHRIQDMDDWNEIEKTFQYYDDEIGKKAEKDHTHSIADIDNLQTTLNDKATKSAFSKLVFDLSGKSELDHKHSIADIDNLQTTLNDKATKSAFSKLVFDLSGKSELDHKHSIADITNLQTTLNGKASASHTHDEYLKKGDPIELTSAQKAELKGEPGKQGNPGTPGRDGTSITTWTGTQAQYDALSSKSSTTLYIIRG
ncbi:phage upper tail fiber protein [Facklamia languida]